MFQCINPAQSTNCGPWEYTSRKTKHLLANFLFLSDCISCMCVSQIAFLTSAKFWCILHSLTWACNLRPDITRQSSHIHKSVIQQDEGVGVMTAPFLCPPFHFSWLQTPGASSEGWKRKARKHWCDFHVWLSSKQASVCFNLIIGRWIEKGSSTRKTWKIRSNPVVVLPSYPSKSKPLIRDRNRRRRSIWWCC